MLYDRVGELRGQVRLMVDDFESVLDKSETVVFGTNDPAFGNIPATIRDGQVLVESVRLTGRAHRNPYYEGLCW
jgi:hypothetical protein